MECNEESCSSHNKKVDVHSNAFAILHNEDAHQHQHQQQQQQSMVSFSSFKPEAAREAEQRQRQEHALKQYVEDTREDYRRSRDRISSKKRHHDDVGDDRRSKHRNYDSKSKSKSKRRSRSRDRSRHSKDGSDSYSKPRYNIMERICYGRVGAGHTAVVTPSVHDDWLFDYRRVLENVTYGSLYAKDVPLIKRRRHRFVLGVSSADQYKFAWIQLSGESKSRTRSKVTRYYDSKSVATIATAARERDFLVQSTDKEDALLFDVDFIPISLRDDEDSLGEINNSASVDEVKDYTMAIPPTRPVSTDEVADAATTADITAWQRRRTIYNTTLRSRPRDVGLWLEFSHFQDADADASFSGSARSHLRSAAKRVALAEKKISILERALEANPSSVELIIALLSIADSVWEWKKLSARWQQAVFRHPALPRLWTLQLRFLRSRFVAFSSSSWDSRADRCIETIHAACTGSLATHVASPGTGHALLDLVDLICSMKRHEGHEERAIATYQTLVEFNCFMPPTIVQGSLTLGACEVRRVDDAAVNKFNAFWESGTPVFGDTGALGWKVWEDRRMERNKLGPLANPVVVEKEDETDIVFNDDSDGLNDQITLATPQWKRWVRAECSRERRFFAPVHGPEAVESEDDPERVIGGDDITISLLAMPPRVLYSSDPLVTATSESDGGVNFSVKLELVLRLLRFLGAPLPPGCSTSMTATCYDPFENVDDFSALLSPFLSFTRASRARNNGLVNASTGLPDIGTLPSITHSALPWPTHDYARHGWLPPSAHLFHNPSRLAFCRRLYQQAIALIPGASCLTVAAVELERVAGLVQLVIDPVVSVGVDNVMGCLHGSIGVGTSLNIDWTPLPLIERTSKIEAIASALKRARKLAKSLLKLPSSRNDLSLWTSYAALLVESGDGIDSARKILITALGLVSGGGSNMPYGQAKACRFFTELEIFHSAGERSRALLILSSLATGCFDNLSLQFQQSPAPTAVAIARQRFDELVSIALKKLPPFVPETMSSVCLSPSVTELVDIIVCAALLEYISVGVEAASALLGSLSRQVTLHRPIAGELLACYRAELVLMHGWKHASPPRLLRDAATAGVRQFPGNPTLLALLSASQTRGHVMGALRKEFADLLMSADRGGEDSGDRGIAPMTWAFAIAIEESGASLENSAAATNRLRVLYSRALATQRGRGCVSLWRHFLAFEVNNNSSMEAARAVFTRAIEACPWAKVLYLDGIVLFPHSWEEFLSLMGKKELRLRVLVEELDIDY